MSQYHDPIKILLDEKPDVILEAMENITHRNEGYAQQLVRRKRFTKFFFFAGLALIVADIALGYSGTSFFTAGLFFLLIWLVVKIKVWRARPKGKDFSPRFEAVRKVINTIRDDVHPKKSLFGHVDLTGWEHDTKIAQETTNAAGLAVAHYRDEWLNFRVKLYDGNMLRFSVIERSKVRKAYWKRSSSGKNKSKPPKIKEALQEMKIKITPNQERYILRASGPSVRIGNFVTQVNTSGGFVEVEAVSNSEVNADDILQVLRWSYDHLAARSPV